MESIYYVGETVLKAVQKAYWLTNKKISVLKIVHSRCTQTITMDSACFAMNIAALAMDLL